MARLGIVVVVGLLCTAVLNWQGTIRLKLGKSHSCYSFPCMVVTSLYVQVVGIHLKIKRRGEGTKIKKIWFSYNNTIMFDHRYYWIPVMCPFLNKVRYELGLLPIDKPQS